MERKRSQSFTVRKARREDCKVLHKLIKELTDFHQCPAEPRLSVDKLEEDGFGKKPLFECLVSTTNESDEPVGLVLYSFTYDARTGRGFFLDKFYVRPEYRKTGMGAALFERSCKIARENQCVKLHCLVRDWNAKAIEFYKSFGAVDTTEEGGWHVMALPFN